MGPYVARLGYRHVGVDIGLPGLLLAREHGVRSVAGSALQVPLAHGCADVVLACEILEHVDDDVAVLAECARLLRPGGLLLLDTLADTRLSVLINVHLFERLPGGPPRGLHDPALFVDRDRLVAEAARHGVRLTLTGMRPPLVGTLRWLARRDPDPRMRRTRPTSVLFQGHGTKEGT